MAKKKLTCRICNTSVTFEDTVVELKRCADCNAEFKETDENRLCYARCSYVKGFMKSCSGTLYLTNERLFLIEDESSSVSTGEVIAGTLVGGVVGRAAVRLIKEAAELSDENVRSKVAAGMKLYAIKSVEESGRGFRYCMSVHTNSGNVYKYRGSELPALKKRLCDELSLKTAVK